VLEVGGRALQFMECQCLMDLMDLMDDISMIVTCDYIAIIEYDRRRSRAF
jgi:hypothetical protein